MDLDTTKKHCSFCGSQGDDEVGLCGGLGAFICAPCVDQIALGLAEQKATGIEPPVPWESMSEIHLLSRLWLIDQTVMQAEQFLVEWAQMIRARGVSWREIGKALGVPARDARARLSPPSTRS